MKKHLFAVCLAVFGALCVRAEIRSACTVTFADLPTIADNVASLGKGTFDPVLTQLVPAAIRNRVSMEAGVTMPWYRFVGLDGKALGIDHYGASAPAATLFKEFGFTVENVVKAAKEVVGK